MNNQLEDEKTNWSRVLMSIIYLIVAGIIFWSFHDEIFYPIPRDGFDNFFRFIWCVVCAFFAFSILAFNLIKKQRTPFPEYLTYYPFMLIVVSALVFSVLHLFEKTSGYIFYYFSFSLVFILSYLIDYFWNIILSFIEKGKKKL